MCFPYELGPPGVANLHMPGLSRPHREAQTPATHGLPRPVVRTDVDPLAAALRVLDLAVNGAVDAVIRRALPKALGPRMLVVLGAASGSKDPAGQKVHVGLPLLISTPPARRYADLATDVTPNTVEPAEQLVTIGPLWPTSAIGEL